MTLHPSVYVPKQSQNQRQQRVAEQVRAALATAFDRGEAHSPILSQAGVTICSVRLSADLKLASVNILPLLPSADKEAVLAACREAIPNLRHYLARDLNLRFTPNLRFYIDTGLDAAQRVGQLLDQ
jgi:ribosome-binding factor A